MSIIHDALKKVQKDLSPKPDETKINTTTPPKASAYLYDTPPLIEITQPVTTDIKKNPAPHKIRTVLILALSLLISIASVLYLYHQYQDDAPKIKTFLIKSYYKMINQKQPPDFKTKAPEDLVPLAQITVNHDHPPILVKPPVSMKVETPIQPKMPPNPTIVPKPAEKIITPLETEPIVAPKDTLNEPGTLNIHGVLSSGPKNIVLINNQVYQEGDMVDGVKIVKITLSSISILNNGKEEIIRVKN